MHNRENVIKEFEKICEYTLRPHEFRVLNDILALLNEQQEQIDRLLEESASNAELAEGYAELLKEQKAVKPVTESSVYDPDTWFFVCGSCKKGVIDCGDKFCRWCGQAVKWE